MWFEYGSMQVINVSIILFSRKDNCKHFLFNSSVALFRLRQSCRCNKVLVLRSMKTLLQVLCCLRHIELQQVPLDQSISKRKFFFFFKLNVVIWCPNPLSMFTLEISKYFYILLFREIVSVHLDFLVYSSIELLLL